MTSASIEEQQRQRAAEEAAALVADRALVDADELLLSSGVLLRFKSIPPFAIRQVDLAVPMPEMPTYRNPNTDRDEPNPQHPAYLAAIAARDEQIYLAAVKVCLIMGVDIASVEGDTHTLESDGWLDELTTAGVEVDVSSPAKRKLAYLQLYAMRTPADIARVTVMAIARAGLTEQEIATTLATFLRVPGRGPDRDGAGVGDGAHGDPVREPDPGARP